MTITRLSLAVNCAVLMCVFSLPAIAQNFGKLFTVDTVSDTVDAAPGDSFCADASGRCSLRAAIQEANVTPATRDAVIFSLPNPSVIDLTLGELAITGRLAIVGPGARRLTIERSFAAGTPDSRVFRFAAGATNSVLRGLKIKNGNASDVGGGLLIEAGAVVTATDLWINGNRSGKGGGVANAGNMTISRSLIDSNEVGVANTGERGGGIANLTAQSTLKIINSTVTANRGNTSGAVDNAGTLTLVHATLAGNFASDSCTTMCNLPGGTITLINSLIGPDTEAPARSALSGSFTSLGNNIVTDARGTSGFTNGVNGDQVSDMNAIDPLLGPLSNNGGETDTLPLLTGSVAIDHGNPCVSNGNCPSLGFILIRSDQRSGYFRGFFSPVDIGAFEFNAAHGSSSSSFGFFAVNQPAFFGGSISVATNATTGEKVYSANNPFGRMRLQNLPGGVWILELRTKRASVGTDPSVVSSEDAPPISLASPGINIVVEQGKPKLDGR